MFWKETNDQKSNWKKGDNMVQIDGKKKSSNSLVISKVQIQQHWNTIYHLWYWQKLGSTTVPRAVGKEAFSYVAGGNANCKEKGST